MAESPGTVDRTFHRHINVCLKAPFGMIFNHAFFSSRTSASFSHGFAPLEK